MSSFPGRFGDWIRSTRESAGLTQVQVARKARVDQPALSRIENGQMPRLPAETAGAIMDALGLTSDGFIDLCRRSRA